MWTEALLTVVGGFGLVHRCRVGVGSTGRGRSRTPACAPHEPCDHEQYPTTPSTPNQPLPQRPQRLVINHPHIMPDQPAPSRWCESR